MRSDRTQLAQLPPYASPIEASQQKGPIVLSLKFLQETRSLVLILANGEIVLYPVDENTPKWDVVGAFEGGLEAAIWSPDETLLMLATSKYSPFGPRFDSNSLQPMESLYR